MAADYNVKQQIVIDNFLLLPKMAYTKKNRLAAEEYLAGILAGDRVILAMAITLVESQLEEDRNIAEAIIEQISNRGEKSIRIGVTGVPGVGKSTFIESFGEYVIAQNKKLAVLAIDPSSNKTGGSILGDKTRMENLAKSPNAFIRPSASRLALGGVAHKTREAVLLCEAAGFDVIIIETVGVGQSEVAVRELVDFSLLLMLAGAGDELQGIKKGIMEMADAIAITKSDGDNVLMSEQAKKSYQNALHLFPVAENGWLPKVTTCSALKNEGMDEIWKMILQFADDMRANGFWEENRNVQQLAWMHSAIEQSLKADFYNDEHVKSVLKTIESQVQDGTQTAWSAAKQLLSLFYKK